MTLSPGPRVGFVNVGVVATAVARDSVFAAHDVRPGDLTAGANGVGITSVAAFRRELRRGIIEEYVTLQLVRDGKAITRIVFLDGIPTALAPAPRAK